MFEETPSDKQIIDALIHHLNEQDGFLTAINCVSTKAILSWLKKQKEQKPAEKQDYSGLNDLERAIHRGFLAAGMENVPVGIIKDTASECMGFLALIDPEPVKWSEEDEKMLRTIISDGSRGVELDSKQISFLKSLRPQYYGDVTMTEAYKMGFEAGKASSWKPSEEQMVELNKVRTLNPGLDALYQQLKNM